MRKTLSLILVIIMVGALLAFPVAAVGSGKISMGDAKAEPGDVVRLDVKLTTNPGLVTMEIRVSFDTAVLELVEVEDTGLVKGSALNPNYGSPYTIAWIDGAAEEDNTATGTIAIFTFRIKADAPDGKTTIRLECKESLDSDLAKNIISSDSGEITVERSLCQTHTYEDPRALDDDSHSRICSVCQYVEKEKHSYSQWNITDESHSRSCDVCGHKQEGSHDWDDGIVIKQANCQEGGQVKYTCKLCQTNYTADTDPSGEHTYDHGCDTDCNICGEMRVTEHTFGTKWSKDLTGHWYECSVCKEKQDVAEHIPGAEATEEKAQTCTVCGFVIVPALSHTHETASEWTTDAQGHWYTCSACAEKVAYAEHSFADACDADCEACGYVRENIHTYPEGWLNDGENHWRICDSCGEQILFAAHVPGVEATTDAPQYCTECGYELAPALQSEKIPLADLLQVDYGWPWWANALAIAVIVGGIATLVIVPLRKKKR